MQGVEDGRRQLFRFTEFKGEVTFVPGEETVDDAFSLLAHKLVDLFARHSELVDYDVADAPPPAFGTLLDLHRLLESGKINQAAA